MNNELLAVFRLYLQESLNLQEKKKKKYKKPFEDQDGDGNITRKDVLLARGVDLSEGDTNRLICPNCSTENPEGIDKCRNCGHPYPDKKDGKEWKEAASENLEEKKKRKRRKKKKTDFDVGGQPQYRARRSAKQIAKQASLTRQYNNAETEAARQKIRDKIDKSREKEGVAESLVLTQDQLNIILNEVIEAEKLDFLLEKIEELEEKKKRKGRKKSSRKKSSRKKKKKSGKSSKGLSAAVKKSLDKKADRRGLTRGSVYSEFRKGLAAYYSSGSRKGMSAHQWAHARVNSANPSKSWAVVKKRKGGKKK